jgi:hypothetical protein
VAIEARQRGQRAALDLDDRDAQRRCVDGERVQGRTALGNDQQPNRLSTRRERFLDWPPTGDQLLVFAQ